MANNFGPPPQYKIGNVVLVAGSADFEVTDGANIGMDDEAAKVAEGDEIYVPPVSKWLTIKAATDNTHGTLIDPCPADCAGTFPLRIRFQAYASRMEGRLATLIATLLKNGNITSLAEADLKTGDFLYADGPGVIKGNQDVQPSHGITDYKTDKAYEKGDLVSFSGSMGRKIYISLKNDNKDAPSVTESWAMADLVNMQPPHGISDYHSDKVYSKGDLVSYDGESGRNIYLSLKNSNSNDPSVTASWQLINLGNLPVIAKTYLNRDGQTNFANTAGDATAITADLAKPLEGDFKSGLKVTLGMTNANAANATLALNGGTAYPIYSLGAAGAFTQVNAGEMLADGIYTLTFSKKINPSSGVWLLPQPKSARFIPAGMIGGFISVNAPSGWLVCEGSPISRENYPDLWAFVQASGALISEEEWLAGKYGAFSDGDGSTTFRIPDLRAEFLRGYDAGRGVDKGRVLGALQNDAMQVIEGGWSAAGPYGFDILKCAWGAMYLTPENDHSGWQANTQNQDVPNAASTLRFNSNRSARTADETRPRNAAVLWCIKY